MADDRLQALYGGFRRLRDFPLDPSCIFDDISDLDTYTENKSTAYSGQVVVVTDGDKKGIYYILPKDTTGALHYIKALDVKDEEEFLTEFRDLKSVFAEFGTNINDIVNNLTNRVVDSEEELSRRLDNILAILDMDAQDIDGYIDTLGEAVLILNNFNKAIEHSSSFKAVDDSIKKIKKLLPDEVINDSVTAENYNPTPDQKLVIKSDINKIKEEIQHTVKVAEFEFGSDKTNETYDEIGTEGRPVKVSEVRVKVLASAYAPVTNFYVRFNNSHVNIIEPDEIDLTEVATFIYDIETGVSGKSKVNCNKYTDFKGASGIVYIKYFD